MAQLFFAPVLQVEDANGAPYSGALAYFYETGTTTARTSYQDSGLTTPHANPVVADTSGQFAPIYLADGSYKAVIKTAAGVTIRTIDPILFTNAVSAVSTGFLYGLTLTNNVSDATNDIDIAVGSARDTTDTVTITLSSAITKRLDANWTLGTGNGGLDTGAVANASYYVWLIRRSDTGVVDALFSTSASAPTMPTNYDQKAKLGKFTRVGASNKAPRSYSQKEVTDWVAYTPTFTGWGTPTGVLFLSRRNGDTLEVKGTFVSGISTGVEARITLGFSGTDNNLSTDANKNTTIAGIANRATVAGASYYTLTDGGVGYMCFGFQSAAATASTKQNGNNLAAAGDGFFVKAEIPIAGW